jgi:hypothetical protein
MHSRSNVLQECPAVVATVELAGPIGVEGIPGTAPSLLQTSTDPRALPAGVRTV